MDSANNNQHGNKFFEGFIWGFIIGGAVIFLLGTKKGKKLLKTITEEGVGNLSHLIEEKIETEDDFEEEEEEGEDGSGNGLSDEKVVKQVKPSIKKRFFRKRS